MLAFRNPSDRFPDKVRGTPRDYALTKEVCYNKWAKNLELYFREEKVSGLPDRVDI